jgi:hypothetical protein
VLERNLGYGLAAADGELAIDASVIRDTQPGTNGWGVGIGCNANYGAASLSLRGSLIAGNVGMGVHLLAAAASIERSVLRDNQASALGGGFGVSAEPSATTGSPAGLAIDHSLIERNDGIGVHARNSDVVVDASVIRDTDPSTGTALQSLPGQGLEVVGEQPVGTPASLALSRSLVERSRQAGVVVMGATAAIESCLIRETRGDGGGAADGVVLIRTEDASTSATVLSTRIEESERAAITSYGGSLVAKQLRGVCNLVDIDGEGYSGSNYAVDDQGDNRCGCPEPSRACMVVTLGFQPAINP